MDVNGHVVAAVAVIGAVGLFNAWTNKRHISPVIIGALVFLLVLSVLDMFGPLRGLASALAMLAVLYVVLTQFPWSALTSLVGGSSNGSKA